MISCPNKFSFDRTSSKLHKKFTILIYTTGPERFENWLLVKEEWNRSYQRNPTPIGPAGKLHPPSLLSLMQLGPDIPINLGLPKIQKSKSKPLGLYHMTPGDSQKQDPTSRKSQHLRSLFQQQQNSLVGQLQLAFPTQLHKNQLQT